MHFISKAFIRERAKVQCLADHQGEPLPVVFGRYGKAESFKIHPEVTLSGSFNRDLLKGICDSIFQKHAEAIAAGFLCKQDAEAFETALINTAIVNYRREIEVAERANSPIVQKLNALL